MPSERHSPVVARKKTMVGAFTSFIINVKGKSQANK